MNKSQYRYEQEARLRRSKIVTWTWETAWAISDGLNNHGLQLEAAKTLVPEIIYQILKKQYWMTLPEIAVAATWIEENLEEIFKKEWL